MEGVLTEINDPNVVLESITSQKSYLSLKPAKKETTAKGSTKKDYRSCQESSVYKEYNDQTREIFIDRMIEGPTERESDFTCKGS